MRRYFDRKSLVCLLLAFTLTLGAPLSRAQSNAHLDKHTQKIYKELHKYKPGSYLHLAFRDHTSRDGDLGKLSATSFSFLDTATNKEETWRYSEVGKVKKGETYIGEGTAPRHHLHVHIPHPF